MLSTDMMGNAWMCNKVLVSIAADDTLMLKHQAISIPNTDPMVVTPDQLNDRVTSNENLI